MSAFEPYLVIGIVLGILGFLIWMSVRAERRTEAFKQFASEIGFRFAPEVDVSRLRERSSVPLFDYGDSERARNVLIARTGQGKVKVFDYQYSTGFQQNRHTQRQTVALFAGGAPALPDLTLFPETMMVRIVEAVGYQDIDFDESPEFSRRYRLRGPDEEAIRRAFDAGTLAFFAERTGWTVEVRSGTVIVYRAGRLCAPENLRTFVDEASEIVRAMRRG